MPRPSPAEIQYEIEHIHDDRSTEMIAAFSVMMILACSAVVLRILARWAIHLPLKADDYSIIAALVSNSLTTIQN